jgi:hypothetical protein
MKLIYAHAIMILISMEAPIVLMLYTVESQMTVSILNIGTCAYIVGMTLGGALCAMCFERANLCRGTTIACCVMVISYVIHHTLVLVHYNAIDIIFVIISQMLPIILVVSMLLVDYFKYPISNDA